jgi:hypothetical protein
MIGCQFGRDYLMMRMFLGKDFWRVAAADSLDDGSHGFEFCTSW